MRPNILLAPFALVGAVALPNPLLSGIPIPLPSLGSSCPIDAATQLCCQTLSQIPLAEIPLTLVKDVVGTLPVGVGNIGIGLDC
jgi:hypothetical protein